MTELVDGPAACRLLDCTPRQLHAWYSRRRNNGFPEPVDRKREASRPQYSPKSPKLWDADALLAWRASYVPSKGGANTHQSRRVDGQGQGPARS